MGWSSGTALFSEVWADIRAYIPEGERVAVAARIMRLFMSHDCDTLDDCTGDFPELEAAYMEASD